MTRRFFIALLLGLITSASFAQSKITLISGKEIDITTHEVKGDWIIYSGADNKQKRLDKYKAFSITDGATEKIFYEPDALNEDPTVDWVRDFIKGEQYAMKHQFEKFDSKTGDWKKRRFSNNEIGGVVVGGAGSILSFYGILVPAVYATVSAQFPAKLPPAPDITPELRNSEAFNYGYSKKKNNQRIRKGFIASAAGLVAGFATFYAIEGGK